MLHCFEYVSDRAKLKTNILFHTVFLYKGTSSIIKRRGQFDDD